MSKKKRTQSGKRSQIMVIDKNKTGWWPPILFILAGLLIFYPPLFKGLFFNKQMFISHIITSIVFSLVLFDRVRHKDYALLRNPLDWAILAYAGAYLLSLIGAVQQGEAIYGFLKALNYFMVYWVVTQVARSYGLVREMLKFLVAGGLVVAVIGILAAVGLSDYPGAFVNGMIMSTLQYSNTMAAYLAVMILIGVTLVQQETSIWLKIVYSLANFLMALAVLGALSKGAWIILVGGALLLLIGMPGMYRIKSFYYLGMAIGVAGVIYSRFSVAIASVEPKQALTYVALGILLALFGMAVWEGLENLWKSQYLAQVIITALFVVLAFSCVFSLGSQVLQTSEVGKEITSLLDTENSSYTARLEFMRCAIEIVKDHPIIGTGAGGWEALYRQYQNYSFWTTETHNHFLQVWVEAGTIGLIAFLSMWLILLFNILTIYKANRTKEDKSSWILFWGIASGTLALGAHSAIDFDLSIPAICMVLWSLFGLVNSFYEKYRDFNPNDKHSRYTWIQVGAAGVLVLLLMVSGVRYLHALNQAEQGDKAFSDWTSQPTAVKQQARLNDTASRYMAAVKSDPNNGHYWASLASLQVTFYLLLNEQQHPQAGVYYQRSIEMMKRAADLRPYDPSLIGILLRNSAVIGDLSGIKQYGQMAVITSPNDPQVYEKVAQIWWDAIQRCLENNQQDQAQEFAQLIIDLNRELLQQISKVNVDHPLWSGPRLGVTPEFDKVLGEAQQFLNKEQ